MTSSTVQNCARQNLTSQLQISVSVSLKFEMSRNAKMKTDVICVLWLIAQDNVLTLEQCLRENVGTKLFVCLFHFILQHLINQFETCLRWEVHQCWQPATNNSSLYILHYIHWSFNFTQYFLFMNFLTLFFLLS